MLYIYWINLFFQNWFYCGELKYPKDFIWISKYRKCVSCWCQGGEREERRRLANFEFKTLLRWLIGWVNTLTNSSNLNNEKIILGENQYITDQNSHQNIKYYILLGLQFFPDLIISYHSTQKLRILLLSTKISRWMYFDKNI